jgi:prolyl-tRNA synthetase
MYWSRLFIPTLRDNPAEAESISHRFLLRAGYLRPIAGGSFSYLTLGLRSLARIERIVEQEMDAVGAQAVLMPANAGAYDTAAATVARGELRSYKQLPQIWYQIRTRLRDDGSASGGLLGSREFVASDSCSFDAAAEGMDIACRKHLDAYRRILDRCGIQPVVAAASQAHVLLLVSDAGDHWVVECPQCGSVESAGTAVSEPLSPLVADPEGDFEPEPFHTPGRKTIADVAEFTGLPATSQMKSLVMAAGGEIVLVLVRGDHSLAEAKLLDILGAGELRPATGDEIRAAFGAQAGSLGPVGVKNMRIMADRALEGRRNMIAGANRDDYHLRNVTPGEDFAPEFFDLRQVAEGDACPRCGGALRLRKAIELAQVRKRGAQCAAAVGLHVTSEAGAEIPPSMGSYAIGLDRILIAAVELGHDKEGIILPRPIAPFDVLITPVNFNDPALRDAAQSIYTACRDSGIDTLLDDRDERPGVKFKDADLIGVPLRVTVGKKVAQGLVEIVERRSKTVRDVAMGDVVEALKA